MTTCICVYVPTPGTALSVHIPLCWVHWHGNYLQHDSPSGHSASAHAYAEVLLLGHQPCRQQRHHTKGSWWVIINILDLFQHKSNKVYLLFFFLLWNIIWFGLFNCSPSTWRLIQVQLSVLERKSLGANQSQSLCAVTSLLSKSRPEMATAPPHLKWLIPIWKCLSVSC